MKKTGFTLAEVLITLGIIGVVAAMTIPTLISNTNGAKFRSQFKKTVSTLNQAGLMAQAQYDIDYSSNTGSTACTATADPTSSFSLCAIFNGTLTGHAMSTTAPKKADGSAYSVTFKKGALPANAMYLTLADGSLVVFNSKAAGCTKSLAALSDTNPPAICQGFIDVNGVTLPNKEVTCDTADSDAIGDGTCVVSNNANHMTDVFPIVFHDATVEPLTTAGRYILTTSK